MGESEKAASIRCGKCGVPASPRDLECPSCRAKLAKFCGECDFPNSLAKKFCDRCGTPLRLPSPGEQAAKPPPAPERRSREPVPPPESGLPRTGIFRLDRADGRAPPGRPEPARPADKRTPAGGLRRAAARAAQATTRTLARMRASPRSLIPPALLLLSAVAILGARRWLRESRPEAALLKASRAYLDALSSGNAEAAYRLLSEKARASCPLEEFRALFSGEAWGFSDLRLARLEPDAAALLYTRLPAGGKPEEERLLFAREGRRWVRPFIAPLLDKAEDAFDRGDPGEARRLARAAAETDPRDALARAYLCESAYALLKEDGPQSEAEEAERDCRAALELAAAYPHSMNPETLERLRAVRADLQKNFLGRCAEAVGEYDLLVGSPGADNPSRCEALLGRAECRLAAGAHAAAQEDFRTALAVCPADEARAEGRRAVRLLSGEAGPEAVALVQAHRQTEGGPTLLEWWDSTRRSLAETLPRGGAPALLSARWSAKHLGGTRYRVTLNAGTLELLSADADPWSGRVAEIRARTP